MGRLQACARGSDDAVVAAEANGERREGAHFARGLACLCALAAVLRAAILSEQIDANPFAAVPWSDAELYWSMAGDLAAGRGMGGAPFSVAPLYPALLALLRAAGGGLVALYALQAALHVATAALVAAAARERFGARAGLAGAALFLLLGEAALHGARALPTTLQLFLAAWLWLECARLSPSAAAAGGVARRPGPLPVARTGAALGLFALAFPAALLLVPLLGLWIARCAGLSRAALATGAALGAIAPATLANAVASGEWIPITAHAGVTLAQGNDARSVGIYTPLAGVSPSILEQSRDAAAVFERETGRRGSFAEVDAWFRDRALAWWRAYPLDAAALFARKLHWTLASSGYDNVATFALEREHGLGRRAALAPLELPWLFGLAALGLLVARRERRGAAPELALLLLPIAVCVVFHYSGRYRLVAAPVACGLAGAALARWRSLPVRRVAALALAALPLAVLAADAATGFGSLEFMRSDFARALARQHARFGRLREAAGDPAAARREYERALAARSDEPLAARALYNLDVAEGDLAAARTALDALVRARPDDAEARLALAWLLAAAPDARLRDGPAALVHADAAARALGPDAADVLLARALALAESGRRDEAVAATLRGEEMARARGEEAAARSFASLRAALRSGRGVDTPPRPLRLAAR